MPASTEESVVCGWRSSRSFVIATACLALFTETLLYGFPVPILPYMLEERLHHDPSRTSDDTAKLLSVHGFITLICSPLLATLLDRTSNRRIPLLLSLGACLTGTLLVACALTLWTLYLGRILQAIAGSAAWLVCVDMLNDNAGKTGPGTMMGLSMAFITMGTVSGPILGGVLLDWIGYWPAWSVPMGMLLLDIIARLVVTQPKRNSRRASKADDDEQSATAQRDEEQSGDGYTETSPLLQSPPLRPTPSLTTDSDTDVENESGSETEIETEAESDTETVAAQTRNFYVVLLQDPSIWTSILNTMLQAGIRAAFSTTLPVHLRNVFNWGPSAVGASFFALQVPIIFLSPILGWVRDRVGVRYPTTAGWALLCPLLWSVGIPGSEMAWGRASRGVEEAIFIFSICGAGIVMPLLQGAGGLHMLNVVSALEKENPHIFGANGGRSRCFALNSISFNTGLMLGPLLAGALFDAVGYYYMNIVFAALCLGIAVITFCFY